MKRNRRLLENCTETLISADLLLQEWNDRSLSCQGDRNARSFLSAVERQTCNSNQLLWNEPGTHLCSRILEVVYTVHCNSDWDSGHSRKKNEHRRTRQRWMQLLLYLSNIYTKSNFRAVTPLWWGFASAPNLNCLWECTPVRILRSVFLTSKPICRNGVALRRVCLGLITNRCL